MNKTLDTINDRIREARRAIGAAELAGLRGDKMMAVKRQLAALKAEHKRLQRG